MPQSPCTLSAPTCCAPASGTSSATAVLGRTAEDLTGHDCAELVHDDDRAAFLRTIGSVPVGADAELRSRVHHADGRVLHVEGSVTNLMADPAAWW